MWRATLEAVCLGTKASLLALAAATGAPPALLLMAGGATRSPFLQVYFNWLENGNGCAFLRTGFAALLEPLFCMLLRNFIFFKPF